MYVALKVPQAFATCITHLPPILCYFTWLLLLVLCLLSLAIILAFQRHWLWCAEIARRADQCVSGRSKAAPLPQA